MAIIAESYTRSRTEEFGEWRNDRSRIIGLDLIEEISSRFGKVEHYFSGRYPGEYRLDNLMRGEGLPVDDYPDPVRIPGKGFQDLVVIAHV